MPGIFINYRRQDALTEARAIYERLRAEFGSASVFIDLEGLDYGEDFAISLEKQLARCRVLLALIGPEWVDIRDARGNRRLDDTDDFVRIELRTALARGVRVVPVLLNGALLPLEQDLPDDLKPLRRRQKLDLDFNRFDADMGRLVGSLRKLQAALDASPATAPAPSPVPVQSVTPPRVAPSEARPRPMPTATDRASAPEAAQTESPRPKPAPAPARAPVAVPAPPPRSMVTPAVSPVQSGPQPVDRKPASQPMSLSQGVAAPIDAGRAAAPSVEAVAQPSVSSPPKVTAPSTESVVEPSSAPSSPYWRPFIVYLVVVLFFVLIVAAALTSSKPPARVAEAEPMSAPPAPSPNVEAVNTAATRLQEPPLTRFRDCESAECPWLVRIPVGSFQMGSPANEADPQSDEGPRHAVTIAQPFALGETEVTRGQFKRFADVTNHRTEGGCDWRIPGFAQTDDHPVVCVNWDDAQAYVHWLSQRTGQTYRLPSEAEWEYAARAGASTRYSWGNSIGRNNANCAGCGSTWDNRSTAPVGRFAANAFGFRDMNGNAWEWTQDCWNGNYNGAPSDGRAWESGDCARRVLRGGSWGSNPLVLRAAIRFSNSTDFRYNGNGFRVARTAP